jgi:hypothetical protein
LCLKLSDLRFSALKVVSRGGAGKDPSVPEQNSPFDVAMDLLVFAPLGIAITAAEELPRLAAKGRAQVSGQINTAKVVGQFAMAQGRKRMEQRFGHAAPTSSSNGSTEGLGGSGGSGGEPIDRSDHLVEDLTYDEMLGTPINDGIGLAYEAVPPSSSLLGAERLAIPGYDSLSASQVVQRLAGLSSEELAAVGEYESAHRARRTVLTRVSQLQGS